MTAVKISALTELTAPAAGDYIPVVDISEAADADKTKRVTLDTLHLPVFPTTPLTSTSFDGDSFSDTAKTKIDLSTAFGAPAGINAIYAFIMVRDSGSAGEWAYLILSPLDIADNGQKFGMQVANDTWQTYHAIIPCDANGDIYYQVYATGLTTFDIYLEIYGYWL
jgi:hypothetical protein